MEIIDRIGDIVAAILTLGAIAGLLITAIVKLIRGTFWN